MQNNNGSFILGKTASVLAFENQPNHPTKKKKVWKKENMLVEENVHLF